MRRLPLQSAVRAGVSIWLAVSVVSGCGSDREFGAGSAAGSAGDTSNAGKGGSKNAGTAGKQSTGTDGGEAGSPSGNTGGTDTGGTDTGGTDTGGSAGAPMAGSAGEGGTEMSGKKPLGAPCGNKDQCDSNFCVDDVCCESACDGVCQACSAAGKCDVKPADDADCGNITCPSDTSCRDYPTAITSNRCASFGACKKQAECPFTAKSQGITCDGVHVCDGDGNCGPVVVCGNTASCQIGPKECCAQTDKSIATCLDDGVACADGSDPATDDTGMLVECDEATDCPLGNVCCWHSGRGSSGVFCKAPGECVPNAGQMYFEAVVCKTGAGSSPCPTGSCTGDVSGVTDWKYCE